MWKANKLTPSSNLRWESSRMMLPEHKEALQLNEKEKQKKTRPEFDDQELAQIESALHTAIDTENRVQVTVFGEYDDHIYEGYVQYFIPHMQQIRMEDEEEVWWINLPDILRVDEV